MAQQRVDLDHTAEQLNTLDEQTTSTADLSIAGSTPLTENTVYYSKIFAPGDGTIHLTQMFAVTGYTGHAKMAVYADNGSGTSPSGTALAVSNEIVNPPAGINIFVFDNSVVVSSFQQLWLAFQTDTAQAWRPNTAPPGDSQGTQAQAYGAFPSANIGATLGPNFHFGEIVVTPLLGRGNVFPTTFRYGLMSLWFEPMSNAGVEWSGGQALDASTTAIYGMTVRYDTSEDPFGPGYGLVTISVSTGSASGSSVTFRASDNVNGTACNIVASIDAVGQVAQCLFNGTLLTPLTSTWVSTDPIATGHMLLTAIIAEIHYGLDRAEFCIADLYADAPASFFDLSIAGNQLKFISGPGGTPTDLGSDASSVTGSVPVVFYRVLPAGAANDLPTNRGTGGGNLFNPFHNLILCVAPPPPAPGPHVNIGTLHRWRGQVGINWRGLALVGDAFTNVVGLSDFNSFTEYGNTMRFLITTPPLHDDRKRIFIPRIEIEVEAAGGLPSNPSEAPLMVLRWSKDGGLTWSSLAPTASMGVIGQYINRLRWINLGSARTWVFELTCTDPVRRYVIGTYADSYKGYG